MDRATKTRITPTTGAGVVLAIALGALPAALVGLELAWLVVIAAISVLLVAPVLAWREVRAVIEITPPSSLRVHAGRATPVTFGIQVQRPCRDLLADVTLPGAAGRERDGAPKVAIECLKPGPACRVPLIARFTSRGTAEALQLRVTSTFPFGLFIATRKGVLPMQIRVLPRLQPRPDPALLRALQQSSPAGPSTPRSRPLARAGLPIGLRAARSGDRLRDIAWKPSVRQSRWVAFEREGHEAEREITLVLHLGVRGASASSLRRTGLAFEAAVSHCATAIDCLYGRSGSVTLEFDTTSADAPLAEIASRTAGPKSTSGLGSASLMDRLSEVQTGAPPHGRGERPSERPNGSHSRRHSENRAKDARADTATTPGASVAGEPSRAPGLGARRARSSSDLRIIFIGMSALEYQRATDTPGNAAAKGGSSSLILGVDANGRVQSLWGSPTKTGRRLGLGA